MMTENPKPLNILFYSTTLPPKTDGLAMRSTLHAWHLQQMGHNVLLTTCRPFIELPKAYQSLKQQLWPGLSLRWFYPDIYIANPLTPKLKKAIRRTLLSFKPDIVHVTLPDPIIGPIAKICALQNIPIVTSYHTDILYSATNCYHIPAWLAKLLLKYKAYPAVKATVALSDSFKQKLKTQLGYKNLLVSPPGINTHIFYPQPPDARLRALLTRDQPDRFLFVYAGRYAKEKDIPYVLTLLKPLKNISIAFIGDGPDKSWQNPSLSNVYCSNAFWSREQLAKAYCTADCVITASEFETLGSAIVEAMACGTPVVAARTQAFKDYIQHQHNGILFDKTDPPPTDKIAAFISDQTLQATIRETLKKEHSCYSFENYMTFYADLYKRTIE